MTSETERHLKRIAGSLSWLNWWMYMFFLFTVVNHCNK